jgi:hypothetical protein
MLDISINRERRKISGRFLSHNRLSARERARLAADIFRARVDLHNLTVRQVSKICRVSVPYVHDALTDVPAKITPPEALVRRFRNATPAELLECARAVGPAHVWDTMIAPLV